MSQQIVSHCSKSVPYTVFDSKWVPQSAKLVAVGQTPRTQGVIQLFELDETVLKETKKIDYAEGIKCCTFAGSPDYSHRHLATGSFNGTLCLWDLMRASTPFLSYRTHKDMIYAVDGCGGVVGGHGAPEVATGGRDGAVYVWDARQKDSPVASFIPNPNSSSKPECWAVAFGNSYDNDNRSILAGYANGDVRLFDLRTNAVVFGSNVGNGVCSVEFDRRDIQMNTVSVTCLEAALVVYDMRTQHPKEGFASVRASAHKSTVWAARHLPQNRDIFATCGGNGSIDLWRYKYPPERRVEDKDTKEVRGVAGELEQLATATLSALPIASLDWHPQKEGLFTCTSFDQTVRVGIVTELNKV
eukprot:GCRY01002168.1.p1 GENE.GCRY01002168.1~~GCRY01002168.1.p1  ORF type:complete len:357 (-),score=59.96 GCRY01002168.1:48-1118(-)